MTGPSRDAPGREGAVLVIVVLLALALLGIAHGLLLSARSDLAATRWGARELETRAAGDAALLAALGRRAGPWMDSVPLWVASPFEPGRVGRTDTAVRWRRAASEVWLVEAVASLSQGPSDRSALPVWSYDPVARLRSLPGVVSVGSEATVSIRGRIVGDSITSVSLPAIETDCQPWLGALRAALPADSMPAVGLLPDSARSPSLGLLGFDELLSSVPVSAVGSGTPGPVERLGACAVDEPWNWGDPDRPYRPCGGFLALRGAAGTVRIEGGAGQVLLIVDGDVALRSGARVYGAVLATGVVSVQDGALIEGFVVAAGGIEISSDATVRGSGCWGARALATHRETLGRPVPLSRAARVGPY